MENVQTIIAEQAPATGFDAYVYEWKVVKYPDEEEYRLEKRTKYTGFHGGHPNDGYFQSATSKTFKKLFSDPRTQWVRTILHYGTVSDMRTKEHQLLKAVDAAKNSDYFNKTNGFGVSQVPNRAYCKLLFDNIKCGAYEIVFEDKKLHINMDYVQVRDKDDQDHVNDIAEAIEKQGGDTRSEGTAKPVIVLKDFHGPGIHRRLNGTHTVKAANQSPSCTVIPVKYIPKEDYKHASESDLYTVGLWLNPIPKCKEKSSNEPDGLRYIRTMVKLGLDAANHDTYLTLEDVGYSRSQINKMIKQVKKEKNKNEEHNLHNVIDWSEGTPADKALKRRMKDLEDDGKVAVVKMSSGAFNFHRVLEKCYGQFTLDDEWKCVIMLYHSTRKAKEEWDGGTSAKWEKILNKTIVDCDWTIENVPMFKEGGDDGKKWKNDYEKYYSTDE